MLVFALQAALVSTLVCSMAWTSTIETQIVFHEEFSPIFQFFNRYTVLAPVTLFSTGKATWCLLFFPLRRQMLLWPSLIISFAFQVVSSKPLLQSISKLFHGLILPVLPVFFHCGLIFSNLQLSVVITNSCSLSPSPRVRSASKFLLAFSSTLENWRTDPFTGLKLMISSICAFTMTLVCPYSFLISGCIVFHGTTFKICNAVSHFRPYRFKEIAELPFIRNWPTVNLREKHICKSDPVCVDAFKMSYRRLRSFARLSLAWSSPSETRRLGVEHFLPHSPLLIPKLLLSL